MTFNTIVSIILVPLGLLCLFRPVLLLYLFTTLPVLKYVPTLSQEEGEFKIMQLGSTNIFAQDYLILILVTSFLILLRSSLITKKQTLFKIFASPITRIIIVLFLWDLFIGTLSYLKGFNLQNVCRRLSNESLMFIAIFMLLIEGIDLKKERFFKFTVALSALLVFFAFWRYGITHEVELTSSGTRRTLLGNSVVIFLFPLCYIFFYSEFFRRHKFLLSMFVILLALGINFAGHRSGYLSFLFVLVSWLFMENYSKIELMWIPLFGISFLIVLFLIIPLLFEPVDRDLPGESYVRDVTLRYLDTFNLENNTTQERLSKWEYSIETAKNAPLLGLGRFPYYTSHKSEEGNQNLKAFKELNRSPHNVFANKLIHQGMIGLALIIVFFYVILNQFKKIKSSDKRYARFLKIYILSFILFSMFNTTFGDPSGRVFFFIPLGFLNLEIFNLPFTVEKTNSK